MDLKYDLKRHPVYRFTADAGQEPYVYGKDLMSGSSVRTVWIRKIKEEENEKKRQKKEKDLLIFSEEEFG